MRLIKKNYSPHLSFLADLSCHFAFCWFDYRDRDLMISMRWLVCAASSLQTLGLVLEGVCDMLRHWFYGFLEMDRTVVLLFRVFIMDG